MKQILLTILVTVLSTAGYAQTNPPAQPQTDIALKLYPKEAKTYVNVYVECERITDIVITIPGTDRSNPISIPLNGRPDYQHKIDVTLLPEGTYTVEVKGDGLELSDTFVIDR